MPYESLPTTGQYYPPASPMNLDYSTNDPRKMSRNNMLAATDQGNQLMQYLQSVGQGQGQAADYWAQQAAQSYGDMSGYSPEERAQIIREQELKGAMTAPGQFDNMYLTGDEQSGMMGDTSGYQTLNRADLDATENAGNALLVNNLAGLQTGLQDATGQHAALYGGALDPTKMSLDPNYSPGVDSALSRGGSAIRGTIDPNALGLSGDFTSRYGLTPEDQQGMVDQAGRTVGTRYAALQDSAAAQAAAQGNTSPMAVAANAARLNAQEAGTAGDVMSNARLAASTEAANRLKTQEQLRLDAERGIQGARTGVEQGLLATGLGARQSTESMRLGSEQELSSQIMTRAQQLGISYEDAARTIGAAGIAASKDIRDTGLASLRYQTDTGSEQARAADAANVARATGIATNRQDTARYVPAQQYAQGSAVNTALSSRYGTVADQSQAIEKERRAFETGSRDYYGTNAQDTNKTLTSAYGAKTGAANDATKGYLDYDSRMAAIEAGKPSLFDKLVGTAVGGIAGYATGGPMGAVKGASGGYTGVTSKKPGQP